MSRKEMSTSGKYDNKADEKSVSGNDRQHYNSCYKTLRHRGIIVYCYTIDRRQMIYLIS